MRRSAARHARATTAAAVALLALVSAAITFPTSWSWTSDQRAAFSIGDPDPTFVFGYQRILPGAAVAFIRGRVGAKERYFLLVRNEGLTVIGVKPDAAARAFARYALLPAVQVEDPNEADVVIGIGVDPETLGVRYSKVERDPAETGVVIGRVAR